MTASVIYQSVFYNLSGYAAESRGLVRELVRQGVQVQICHVGPQSPEHLDPVEVAELQRLETTPVDPERSLYIVAQPPMWPGRPFSSRAVIRTMFETDRIRPEWVKNCARFGEVWVPSRHNRAAFVASGLAPEHVRIVRGGIDTELFRPGAPPIALHARKEFAFLSVFEWHWRKGWDLLIRAYCEEFRPEDPVTLYLKVNQIGGQTAIISELDYLLRCVLGRSSESTPDIVVIDHPLGDTEMPGLYAAVDAFVLPSRGEGYGRPFLEAMACGLPVIGTAWGGQTDFLTPETGYPLAITGLEPVLEYEPREVYRGLRWASPDVHELRRLLRHLFDHQDEARIKGNAARRAVVEGWDYRVAAAAMAGEISRVLAERGTGDGGVASAQA